MEKKKTLKQDREKKLKIPGLNVACAAARDDDASSCFIEKGIELQRVTSLVSPVVKDPEILRMRVAERKLDAESDFLSQPRRSSCLGALLRSWLQSDDDDDNDTSRGTGPGLPLPACEL